MCVHNPSAAQSWVRRVQRPVALGKAPCGVPVVVDQGDKVETHSAMIPLLSVQVWLLWTCGCWDGDSCGALSGAAGPGAHSSSISFHRDRKFHMLQGADGRVRRQSAGEQPHRSAEAAKHVDKAPGSANSILPRGGAGCGQSDNPGSADTGYHVCRLHPQPAACRASQAPPPLQTHTRTAARPPAACCGDAAQPHRSPVLLGAMW